MTHEHGFSIIELLVGTLLVSVMLWGAIGVLSAHTRSHTQQDLLVARQQNLRTALEVLRDTMRVAGSGVPSQNLASWIPWVSGFDVNPKIVGSAPATVSIARCSPFPVATLSARPLTGATTLSATSAVAGLQLSDVLDTGAKRLVLIGGNEHAHVKSAGSSSITIDTDPTTAGNQGLQRSYPASTPLCRVDVLTFSIHFDTTRGVGELRLNEHQGSGGQALADGITDLGVTTVDEGRRYRIALTAQTERADPLSGETLTATLASEVVLRGAPDE